MLFILISGIVDRCLDDLYSLTLHGNPIEERKGYRNRVLSMLPQLKSLDFTNVTSADIKRIQIRKSATASAQQNTQQTRAKSMFWYIEKQIQESPSHISNEVKQETSVKKKDFWDEFYPRIPIDRDRRKSPWVRGFNKYEEFDRFALFPSYTSVTEILPSDNWVKLLYTTKIKFEEIGLF